MATCMTLAEQFDVVDGDEVAELLKLTPKYVKEQVTNRPDFPEPYRVGRHRLWARQEVVHWFRQCKEKKRGKK